MNRERAKSLLPIITAFAEGKQVQVRISKDWHDLEDAVWDDDNEYRIKPKRRKVWVVFGVTEATYLYGIEDHARDAVRVYGGTIVCVEEPEQ